MPMPPSPSGPVILYSLIMSPGEIWMSWTEMPGVESSRPVATARSPELVPMLRPTPGWLPMARPSGGGVTPC